MMLSSKTVAINIERPILIVADYLGRPENFPAWADGLGKLKDNLGDNIWTADTPTGPVKVRFSPKNAFGIADHWVLLGEGEEIYVPVRVIPNGEGCTVALTLFRQPSMTGQDFTRDRGIVQRDLNELKKILEG